MGSKREEGAHVHEDVQESAVDEGGREKAVDLPATEDEIGSDGEVARTEAGEEEQSVDGQVGPQEGQSGEGHRGRGEPAHGRGILV